MQFDLRGFLLMILIQVIFSIVIHSNIQVF